MNNNLLNFAFDNVAQGKNTKYWVAFIRGYKGFPTTTNRPDEVTGYRLGLRYRSLCGTME